jgi:outer membrane protein assembly factor BamB
MGVGSIHQDTEQRIVIVTQEWNVVCFDMNLTQKWEYQAPVEIPPNHILVDAAVVISNISLVKEDQGLVVVSAATVSSLDSSYSGSLANVSYVTTYMTFSGDQGILRWKQGPLHFLDATFPVRVIIRLYGKLL